MARTSFPLSASEVLLMNSLSALGDTGVNEALKKSGNSIVNGNITGSLTYQGTWNATTNTPTLASGVGTLGYYYYVSVAGTTNIDGITDWQVGDMLLFNGTAWQKVDNTDAVTSVAGMTGAVVLSLDNLTDVAITGVGTGDFLRYNGTNFVNTTIGASDIPSGIDATKIGNGDVTNTELSYIASATGTTGTGNLVFSAYPTFTGTATFDRIDANTLRAVGSGGLLVEANNGTDVALFGAGGGAGVTLYGGLTVAGTITQTAGQIITSTSANNFINLDNSGNIQTASRSSINNYIDYDNNTTATALWNLISDQLGTPQTIFSAREDGVFTVQYTNATTNVFTITGSTLTTGSSLRVYDNSSDATVRRVIYATNDHASATGCIVAHLQQDSTANALYIDHNENGISINVDGEQTTAICADFVCDILTTGSVLRAYSNSGDTSSRNLVSIINDNSSATGTTVLNLQQDSTGSAIKITSAGNACSIVCTGSTQNTFTVANSSLTTGWLADFSSNSADTSSRYLLLARNSNAAAVGAVSLYASQAANGACVIFTSQATTSSYSFLFQADALTSGTGILMQSSSASSSSRSILHIYNTHSGAIGAIPLNITSAAVISTNFKMAAQFNGFTLWTSNGNTPNATLSGTIGDVCIGADSGKIYYCGGGTTWTAA